MLPSAETLKVLRNAGEPGQMLLRYVCGTEETAEQENKRLCCHQISDNKKAIAVGRAGCWCVLLYLPLTTFFFPNWTRICKCLRSPAIDYEESIPPDGEWIPSSFKDLQIPALVRGQLFRRRNRFFFFLCSSFMLCAVSDIAELRKCLPKWRLGTWKFQMCYWREGYLSYRSDRIIR